MVWAFTPNRSIQDIRFGMRLPWFGTPCAMCLYICIFVSPSCLPCINKRKLQLFRNYHREKSGTSGTPHKVHPAFESAAKKSALVWSKNQFFQSFSRKTDFLLDK